MVGKMAAQVNSGQFWRALVVGLAIAPLLLAAVDSAAALPDVAQLPVCDPKVRFCVAVQLWCRADGDQIGWLTDQIAAANERLRVVRAGVQVVAVAELPTDQRDVQTVGQRTALGLRGAQAPMRWFVVDRLIDDTDPKQQRKGVTWRNGKQFWVIEANSAWRWVLAHELGHVLGLPHSTEAASIMNKTPRAWPPPWRLGYTPREQPTVRKTLARLVQSGQLQLVAPQK